MNTPVTQEMLDVFNGSMESAFHPGWMDEFIRENYSKA